MSKGFFNDREVRAVWDDGAAKWWFAAVDVVAALSGSANPGNYWRVLKNRLKKAGDQLLTKCKGFKMTAPGCPSCLNPSAFQAFLSAKWFSLFSM